MPGPRRTAQQASVVMKGGACGICQAEDGAPASVAWWQRKPPLRPSLQKDHATPAGFQQWADYTERTHRDADATLSVAAPHSHGSLAAVLENRPRGLPHNGCSTRSPRLARKISATPPARRCPSGSSIQLSDTCARLRIRFLLQHAVTSPRHGGRRLQRCKQQISRRSMPVRCWGCGDLHHIQYWRLLSPGKRQYPPRHQDHGHAGCGTPWLGGPLPATSLIEAGNAIAPRLPILSPRGLAQQDASVHLGYTSSNNVLLALESLPPRGGRCDSHGPTGMEVYF